MKLLVLGSGGREHAIAWRLAQSPRVQKVFVAPGNGGTAREPGLENVVITAIDELANFALTEDIYLTVVGPEAPLAEGVDSANISYWFKGPGDSVKEGEELVELVTEKATFSMPSPAAGKIIELLAGEGESVKVGQIIAAIG